MSKSIIYTSHKKSGCWVKSVENGTSKKKRLAHHKNADKTQARSEPTLPFLRERSERKNSMFHLAPVYLGLLFCLLSACGKNGGGSNSAIVVDTKDAVVQSIFDFANRRETQAILPFLVVENTMHRYTAAMALASVQDSTAVNDLGNALNDDHEQVRWAAAFALGQTGNAAAAPLLVEAFQTDTVRFVQGAILEAIGRCGTEEHLKYLSTTPPYPIKDTLLLKGQALGLYRFATRGMVYDEGVRKIVIEFIANPVMPQSVRMIAAAFLARAKNINLDGYSAVLLESVAREKEPYIRQFLVTGVAKLKSKEAMFALRRLFKEEEDYRVRSQIMRSMSYFNYDSVRVMAFEALKDTNVFVRETAADFFIANGQEKDAVFYSNLGDAHPNWLVACKLQEASLKALPYFRGPSKQFISQKLRARYLSSQHLYEKAQILRTMGNYSGNYRFAIEQAFPRVDTVPVHAVIKSSAAEALVAIRQHPDLPREWGLGYARVLDEIHAAIRKMLESGDPAMMAIVAQAMSENPDLYKTAFPDTQFLSDARRRLQLPRDIETDIMLQQAIAALSGKTLPTPKADKSNFVQIDWQTINILKDKPEAVVYTNKGSFSLLLYPLKTPATVTQFLQLVKADFYTQKTFHRVVPNFVAQAGCSRGDGWGGFGVVAPSEFSDLRYDDEGWVGMASAGKDTEGTQFFITHSPTPHLDGRYTIFAKVSKGMEVVHTLMVGDTIKSIQISN